MPFRADRDFAMELDLKDPLRNYGDRFCIPAARDGSPVVYLAGNSLGLQPKSARAYLEQELNDWASLGVRGHLEARSPWLSYHENLSDQTARLVGALPSEVVVMNSLTVNLHLMMVSFFRPTPDRRKILMEAHAFPSDQYAVKSQILFHGLDPNTDLMELRPRRGEDCLRTEDILSAIDRDGDSIALILLGGVNYLTGQAFDLKEIASAGRERGCIVGLDLAHAAGNIKLQLHDWNVDFAVWCTYKYLNGGPGSVGGCFVHERHNRTYDMPRFAGWWGHNKETRFLMGPEFDALPGAEGWQLSNAPIFSMAALRSSMEIFDEIGMDRIRRKSETLTAYLEFLLQTTAGDVSITTPSNPDHRGAQLSLRLRQNGHDLHHRILDAGVVCDWREPDIVRVAPVPLYNSFEDVFRFVEVLNHLRGNH